ncbi:MAG: thymidine phosphorylase [Acidobacteriota bacterium]
MRAVDIIRAKRDGEALSRGAIEAFVAGVTDGSWPDYQISALLMAVVLRGMTAEETAWLTDAMVRSGARVDLAGVPGPKVGKHSTGGVGDKVSIVLAPLAAACGVVVPKMSGRGLGHTGGTLDKLEAIPGFRVGLSLDEFRTVLADVGCCLISQSREIVPADKKLYALRDMTATIESLPLIAASVMSKKIAEGSDAVVLDVKCGGGAFMKRDADARALARALVAIGAQAGIRTEALVTTMEQPLGRAVGNALEVAECIATLRGEGPADLAELVLRLATRMLLLAGAAASELDAGTRLREALRSGAALARFRAMVERQGGDGRVADDPERLPRSPRVFSLLAGASGFVTALDAEAIGVAAMRLGAGRARMDDVVDPAAGIVLARKVGDRVLTGDPLMTLHYADEDRLAPALETARAAVTIGTRPPAPDPLVRAWVHEGGETSYV